MRLYLVRHGEMAGDPYGTPSGPVSGCLSDNGIRQAADAAEALCDSGIGFAFSSSYGRALQTAEIVLVRHPGAHFEVRDYLQEWHPNRDLREEKSTVFERMAEAQSVMPVERQWKTDAGEGCFEMYARIIPPFLDDLDRYGISARNGGYVLAPGVEGGAGAVFAHGGSLGVLLSFLLGIPPFPLARFGFDLTGIAEVNFKKQGAVHYPVLRIPAWK